MGKKMISKDARETFSDDLDIAAWKALKKLEQIATSSYDDSRTDFGKLVATHVEACKILLVAKLKATPSFTDNGDIESLYESFKIEYKTTAVRLSESQFERMVTHAPLTLEQEACDAQ